MRIGLLHPGAMGVSVGASLIASGHEVLWCGAGRSEATRRRAEPFTETASLEALAAASDAIISVCPPDQAVAQAESLDFKGLYVDGNAVSIATAKRIAARFGDRYVDGGIIGPPALKPGTTRLYLSGARAEAVRGWFTAGALEARVVGTEPTAASALKMSYAAYTKGSAALLIAVCALAENAGVREALETEWRLSQPDLPRRAEVTAPAVSGKAWRFEGEMREIAETFEQLGLPASFHLAAADLYARLADFKDEPPASLAAVLDRLR